jgi:geranylgeranyl diphosphate synthase type I
MTMTLPPALHRSRAAFEPALRTAIDRFDPASREVAAYHLGWADADGQPTASGGKALRPALALLSAQAVGAPAEIGVPGAVAVELVHNFSLLHDDLMDGDVQRRHRPTVWAVWGASTAILVGDAMLSLAYEVLAEAGGDVATEAAGLLGSATQALIRGQVNDLAFERRSSVTVAECQAMAADKTGALMGASAAIGAVLAGADAPVVDGMCVFGAQLGLAFQLVDDLLGIWGDPETTGKAVGADLRARKKSLPITYALESGTAAGRELAGWIATDGPDSDQQVERAAHLVEDAGGRDWTLAEAHRRLDAAASALDVLPVDAGARDALVELGHFVVMRQR